MIPSNTDERSQASVEVEAQNLFRVDAWTAKVEPETRWIDRLVRDMDLALELNPMDPTKQSANQTQPDLHLRSEAHWIAFFGFVRSTFEEILASAPEHRYQSFDLTSWGVRMDSDSTQKDLRHGPSRVFESHNHSPAVLTSVFSCELPNDSDPSDLATIFHNPARHIVCPWQPRVVLKAPEVGMLLVFPGWLEHSAPVVMPIAENQRRFIITTDYFPRF